MVMTLPLLMNLVFVGAIVGVIVMLYNKSKLKQIHFNGVDSENWDSDVRNENGKIKMGKPFKIGTTILLVLMAIPVISSIIMELGRGAVNNSNEMGSIGLIEFSPTFLMNFLTVLFLVLFIAGFIIVVIRSLLKK